METIFNSKITRHICIEKECNKIAIYSKCKNSTIGSYCYEHRPHDYYNITSHYCIEKNCNSLIIPYSSYCYDHKETKS